MKYCIRPALTNESDGTYHLSPCHTLIEFLLILLLFFSLTFFSPCTFLVSHLFLKKKQKTTTTGERAVETSRFQFHQGDWLWKLVLHSPTHLHVHPIAFLPLAWSHPRSALWSTYRYVEFRYLIFHFILLWYINITLVRSVCVYANTYNIVLAI